MNRHPAALLILLSSTVTVGAFSPALPPFQRQQQQRKYRSNDGRHHTTCAPTPTSLQLRSVIQGHTAGFNNVQSSSSSTSLASTTTTTTTPRQFTAKKRIATLMAFLTGWADFLLFTKYKFFATMMTGNSMWFASALVESRYRDVAFYVSVIGSYIMGVGTFRRAELDYKDKALNGLFAPIVVGMLVGSDLITWRDGGARWLPALMLSYAWGIINSGEL